MPQPFADDVATAAATGWDAIEVWLTKLENHLAERTIGETRDLLERHRIRPVAAAYQGGLLLAQGEQRREHLDQFRRRLDLCQAFAIPTLLVIPDFADSVNRETIATAVASLKEAAAWAEGYGVRLAIEFRSTAKFCSSLDTALAIVEACGADNVGVCLDLFHFYTGPSKLEDLQRAPPDRLFHVQICDLAGVPRELAQDRDRVLPGDGDFRINEFLRCLAMIGFDGYIAVEVLNPVFWQLDAETVLDVTRKAVDRYLEREAGTSRQIDPQPQARLD